MVVAGRDLIFVGGKSDDPEKCVPLEDAFNDDIRLRGLPLGAVAAIRFTQLVEKDMSEVSVRIGRENVRVRESSCFAGEETDSSLTREVAVACPQERCGRCVLRLAGGEDLLETLKNVAHYPEDNIAH